jgi:hypothetical protein
MYADSPDMHARQQAAKAAGKNTKQAGGGSGGSAADEDFGSLGDNMTVVDLLYSLVSHHRHQH